MATYIVMDESVALGMDNGWIPNPDGTYGNGSREQPIEFVDEDDATRSSILDLSNPTPLVKVNIQNDDDTSEWTLNISSEESTDDEDSDVSSGGDEEVDQEKSILMEMCRAHADKIIFYNSLPLTLFKALKTYCVGRQLDINQVIEYIAKKDTLWEKWLDVGFTPMMEFNNTYSRVNEALELIFIYCIDVRIRPLVVAEVLRKIKDD